MPDQQLIRNQINKHIFKKTLPGFDTLSVRFQPDKKRSPEKDITLVKMLHQTLLRFNFQGTYFNCPIFSCSIVISFYNLKSLKNE
jgi:hypothetical protein